MDRLTLRSPRSRTSRRIEFRVGIHLGDVVEESDGDLMGDGVNIAARLEGIADPGGICLSEDTYRQVRDRLKEPFIDLGDIGTAQVDAILGAAHLTDDPVKALAAAEVALTKALLLVPNNAIAHHFMGVVQRHTNRPTQAIAEFERALTLNPNLANTRANIGVAKLFDGRAEETEGDVNEALQLSPRDQRAWVWMLFLGSAKIQLGMDEDAVKWFRRGIELNPNLPLTHFFLAAALILVSMIAATKAIAAEKMK